MPLSHSPAELSAWLRLSLEPGVGPATAYTLLAALGLPEQIYDHGAATLARHVPQNLAIQLAGSPSDEVLAQIERTLQWVAEPGRHILTLSDPAYPQQLLNIADPPVLLYVTGDPTRLTGPSLAVVGARSATPGGEDNARAFARHLAGHGWCVISGLAQGIDAAAHEGALLAGEAGAGTVAVMGTGIDRVYPASHRDLAHRIAAHGALVSELPLGTPALKHHFPQRNRLVAGLARGVLVVEAAKQSGSLITARLAAEGGREVFAIPGSIHSPLSRGCHALIRQGAKLVETAQDITDELGSTGIAPADPPRGRKSRRQPASAAMAPPAEPAANDPAGDHDEPPLLRALSFDPLHPDTLQARTGLDTSTLQAQLLELELAGHVARIDGGRFQRLK
ncbi:Smf protein [Bordetella ansorpii]|uniref:Smf protein n=1 Tax=Bordetella ansorpii TaxID=288768 RepID=A0A157SA80_9BORD|nr:DNA-processing protein DprA [Bordetella ansorpii]SAI67332.1 Smf protein [Bordetella ansorpii]